MSRCARAAGSVPADRPSNAHPEGVVRANHRLPGDRADAFVDAAIVFFVLAPFLMVYALRLAAQRRHREHRNFQAGLLLAAIVPS